MTIQYRSVEIHGKRVVECPQRIWGDLQAASESNPDIPAPAPVNDPIFYDRKNKTKTYYTGADLKRLVKGEIV